MPYASCHLQCSAAGSARTSRDRPSRLVIGATLARAERRTTLTRGGRVPFTNTVAPYPASCRSLPLSFFDRLSLLRACAVTLKFTLSRSSRGTRYYPTRNLVYRLAPRPSRTAFSFTRAWIAVFHRASRPADRSRRSAFHKIHAPKGCFGVRVYAELVRNSALYTPGTTHVQNQYVASYVSRYVRNGGAASR